MCILFFYVNPKPNYGQPKLILASNRDEQFVRPAIAAAPWKQNSHVIGGLDMTPGKEGGTWLAISSKDDIIKIGALLNINGETTISNGLGRGCIVSDYVTSQKNETNKSYVEKLIPKQHFYNPFSFISIEFRKENANIQYYSNAPATTLSLNTQNVYGFGNSSPEKPYKKVVKGKLLFENIIKNYQNEDVIATKCLDLLKSKTKYWPDDELMKRSPQWAEDLSSIFVNIEKEEHGTRTHSVILIDSKNNMKFYEENLEVTQKGNVWAKSLIERNL